MYPNQKIKKGMNKKNLKYTFLIVLIFIFSNCKNHRNKKLIKEYYSSGKVKSYGWYMKDTIPIDTIITLYEDGNLLSKEVYDSLGKAKIAISYYNNGKINKIINYKNGLANGFLHEYNKLGKIENKYFYYNDQQIGDIYGFELDGNINHYGFLDFEKHNRNLINYNTLTGEIIKDIRQKIFIDSLEISIDSLNKPHTPTYELLIIISNPPKCRSVVKIDYLTKNNSLIKSDSVINKNYYLKTERLPDSISTIYILGSQYDSIKKKTIFQKSIAKLIEQ